MLPSIALVGSALVYLAFLCALGVATGVSIALLSRRRPTGREMVIDLVLAGTAAVLSAFALTVYQRARGLSSSGPPTLIPIAVGSVTVRHIVRLLRREP
jgi:uncharacterized protein (DUF2062 family)